MHCIENYHVASLVPTIVRTLYLQCKFGTGIESVMFDNFRNRLLHHNYCFSFISKFVSQYKVWPECGDPGTPRCTEHIIHIIHCSVLYQPLIRMNNNTCVSVLMG